MNGDELVATLRLAKDTIISCGLHDTSVLRSIKARHAMILEKDPSSTTSLAHYGYSLMALGELESGVALFRQIVTTHPEASVAHYFLLLGLFSLGKAYWPEAAREVDLLGLGKSGIDDMGREFMADTLAAGHLSTSDSNGALGIVRANGSIDILTTASRPKTSI
jgi:hypothetical protein